VSGSASTLRDVPLTVSLIMVCAPKIPILAGASG
jgi:hypothetical protein